MPFRNPITTFPASGIIGAVQNLDTGNGSGPRVVTESGPNSNRITFYSDSPDESAGAYIEAAAPGIGENPVLRLYGPDSALSPAGPSNISLDDSGIGLGTEGRIDLSVSDSVHIVRGITEYLTLDANGLQLLQGWITKYGNTYLGDITSTTARFMIWLIKSLADGFPTRSHISTYTSAAGDGIRFVVDKDSGSGYLTTVAMYLLDSGKLQISVPGRTPYSPPIVQNGSGALGAVAAGAGGTFVINFTANLFTAAPNVFVTCNATRLNLGMTATSTASATIRYDNFTAAPSGAATYWWTAIQVP